MSSTEILKAFEGAYALNPLASLDDATQNLSTWIAENRGGLSDQDFATLTAIGGVLFGRGLETRWIDEDVC